jgi:hypothetical protein
MRKLNLLLCLLVIIRTVNIYAQAPQLFKYQAMARNANNEVLVNKQVSLLVEIIHESATIYSESHTVLTNQFGLINIDIGNGNAITGNFAGIDWSLGDYYVAVSLDPNGGTNYQNVGTAQLLSVPYALFANKAGNTYWNKMQSDLNYNNGKVMIGSPEFLTNTGDQNWIPKLSVEGGFWPKMPDNISTTDIDNLDLNNDSIGVGLPVLGLYSIYDADFHLRGFWGVNIDRNGGYTGYDNVEYKGLNPDAGCFAVRYRTSPTEFRTDFIIDGKGNVGVGITNPQRTMHIKDVIRLAPISAPPSNPAEGDIYMDANTHKLMVYDGTTWQSCW